MLTPRHEVPEVVKRDCQNLVDGQLLFEPSEKMRQGQSYPVFARLTRNSSVKITEGLNASDFVVVNEKVSCEVSMTVGSEEQEAFLIEDQPAGKDTQVLEPKSFTEWDWRVTPQKHGTLHLLLWVAPMLYVDGIGQTLKIFKQPARVITVTPDYWYECTTFLNYHWAVLSTVLTAILIPLSLWFRKGIVDWVEKRFKKKDVFYPLR